MEKKDTQSNMKKGRKGKGAGRFGREKSEFEEKLLDLARVTRVVAGGKRFRFRATMVVGNKKGKVGVGVAKGADVAQAIQKAVFQAKKNLVDVPLINGTIPRDITVKYSAAVVYMKPAPAGRGINAGGAVRVVSELGGVSDIIGKSLSRTTNKLNTARATIKAFEELSKTIKIDRKAGRMTERSTPKVEAQEKVEEHHAA